MQRVQEWSVKREQITQSAAKAPPDILVWHVMPAALDAVADSEQRQFRAPNPEVEHVHLKPAFFTRRRSDT